MTEQLTRYLTGKMTSTELHELYHEFAVREVMKQKYQKQLDELVEEKEKLEDRISDCEYALRIGHFSNMED